MELVNDGSGLGFGIVGGKATGVVVRTLVPGSVADKVGVCVSSCITPMLLNIRLSKCHGLYFLRISKTYIYIKYKITS